VGGTVWSFSPDTISIGPRSGLRVSTLSSVRGLKFAVAACQSGAPGAGTANVSNRRLAWSSSTALANE